MADQELVRNQAQPQGVLQRNLKVLVYLGVAVLVIPEVISGVRQFKIWCDPTFGAYLADSLGTVVVESGGKQT